MQKPRFAVVGASITGSVCATLLKQLGYDVTVFEKSAKASFVERGAGMWLPETLIQTLIDKRVIANDFSYLPIYKRPIYWYDNKAASAKLLATHPMHSCAIHWADLYNSLCKMRPEEAIRYESEVTDINANDTDVTLTVNHQEKLAFDYCIFTDGIGSIGRNHLFPEAKPTFVNTTVWRGTLAKVTPELSDYILHQGVCELNERGHMTIYLVPNANAKAPEKDYKVNWLFYEKVDAEHPLFMGDMAKARQNIPQGELPAEYLQYLHALADTFVPSLPRSIIHETKAPFVQAMHERLVPSYLKGNCCLIGDASIMLRPHTGAGATKGIEDVLALIKHLQVADTDIASALQRWNDERYASGKAQYLLGQHFGEAFVTDMLDWPNFSRETIDKIWQEMASKDCWWYVPPAN